MVEFLIIFFAAIVVLEACVFTNNKDEIDLYIIIIVCLLLAMLIGVKVMQ